MIRRHSRAHGSETRARKGEMTKRKMEEQDVPLSEDGAFSHHILQPVFTDRLTAIIIHNVSRALHPILLFSRKFNLRKKTFIREYVYQKKSISPS